MYRNIRSNNPSYENFPKLHAAIQDGRDVDALPADIVKMIDRNRELRTMTPGEAPAVTPASTLVAQGMDHAEAVEAESKAQAAHDAHRKASAAHYAAMQDLDVRPVNEFTRRADEIIETTIRARVDALVNQVRPHVEKLARFAPQGGIRSAMFGHNPVDVVKEFSGFDALEMLRTATSDEITAFQACIQPEVEFQKVATLWLRALQNGEGSGYHPNSIPTYTGGVAVWENPEEVPDLTIRGQAVGTNDLGAWPTPLRLMTLAAQPKTAGLRLASLREISDRYERELTDRTAAEKAKAQANFLSHGSVGDPWTAVRETLANL